MAGAAAEGGGSISITWLSRARASAHTSEENDILDRLEQVVAEYDAKRTKAMLQFDRGQRNEADLDAAPRSLAHLRQGIPVLRRVHRSERRLCRGGYRSGRNSTSVSPCGAC